MDNFTIVRQLDAPLDFAFSWLTDYQADDMVILGGKPGARKIERTAPNQFHLRNNFLETKYTEDMIVTLFPPDRWEAEGRVLDEEKPLANYHLKWKLEPTTQEGSRLTLVAEGEPVTLVARIYGFLRGRKTIKKFESDYDAVALEVAKDYKERAKANSVSGATI